jgi:4-hydroxy-tetrahydrodipicolinate reductase
MKIAIIGYGKMGKTIEALALAKGHEVVLRITDRNLSDLTTENLKKADVAIEFTTPLSAFDNISLCMLSGVPVVSGTTAWLDKLEAAKAICAQTKGAFFYASNFSIGVNIFFALNKYLAEMMEKYEDYNPTMEEIHHTQKLDAPSGTGITLAEGLLEKISRKSKWVNEATTVADELALVSKRIDKVPGTHSVNYSSAIDTIEISHVAHSREGFAKGALNAAEWIVGKQGFFGMNDMLGF